MTEQILTRGKQLKAAIDTQTSFIDALQEVVCNESGFKIEIDGTGEVSVSLPGRHANDLDLEPIRADLHPKSIMLQYIEHLKNELATTQSEFESL